MQGVLSLDGPRPDVSVAADAAALQVRKIVNRMVADEQLGGKSMTRREGLLLPAHGPGAVAGVIPNPPWFYSGDLLTVEYRTDPARVAELLPGPARARAGGPGRGRVHLGRLAVVLGLARGAAGPGARAVQGGVRRRAVQLRGPDLLALRLHLGRQGLRDRPRHAPGLPEEARLDLADAAAPVRPGCAADRCRRHVRRDAGRRRPSARRGRADPARRVGDQRIRERAPDGAPPHLPGHRARRAPTPTPS